MSPLHNNIISNNIISNNVIMSSCPTLSITLLSALLSPSLTLVFSCQMHIIQENMRDYAGKKMLDNQFSSRMTPLPANGGPETFINLCSRLHAHRHTYICPYIFSLPEIINFCHYGLQSSMTLNLNQRYYCIRLHSSGSNGTRI